MLCMAIVKECRVRCFFSTCKLRLDASLLEFHLKALHYFFSNLFALRHNVSLKLMLNVSTSKSCRRALFDYFCFVPFNKKMFISQVIYTIFSMLAKICRLKGFCCICINFKVWCNLVLIKTKSTGRLLRNVVLLIEFIYHAVKNVHDNVIIKKLLLLS